MKDAFISIPFERRASSHNSSNADEMEEKRNMFGNDVVI